MLNRIFIDSVKLLPRHSLSSAPSADLHRTGNVRAGRLSAAAEPSEGRLKPFEVAAGVSPVRPAPLEARVSDAVVAARRVGEGVRAEGRRVEVARGVAAG